MDIAVSTKLDILIALALLAIIGRLVGAIARTWKKRARGEIQKEVLEKFISEGSFEDALQAAESYHAKYPGDPTYLWYRATVMFKLGRQEEARKLFAELVAKEPLWKDDAQKYLEALEVEI